MKALYVAAAVSFVTSGALADRADDINAHLAAISGQDPIKSVIAAEAALASDDFQLRNMALEAALKSTNSRVREVAFSYVIGVQKTFTVDIVTPKNADTPFFAAATATSTLRFVVDHFDKAHGQFDGGVPVINGWVKGTVARDGITATFRWNADCTLRLSTVEGEYLSGTLKCGTQSLKVQSALR